MFEIQKPHLQKIIGVDKKNPVFTLWRDPESSGGIHVYFGTELMEVVPDDRNNPQFKLMNWNILAVEIMIPPYRINTVRRRCILMLKTGACPGTTERD